MSSRIKGELKIEFYAHLNEIRDLYFNQGIRIFKILHQKMVEKYSLTISYKMFCYYAKKELKVEQGINIQPIANVTKEQGSISKEKGEVASVIIASPNFSKVKRYVPFNEDNN